MSRAAPIVSVIIPCYNQGRFLEEAVSSVRAQTLPDWECLIVNDGSMDCTGEVGRGLADLDSRVFYVEKANGGLASARNYGLDRVSGRYVQFVDSDDTIETRKFERQVALLEGVSGLGVCYSDHVYYSDIPGDDLPAESTPYRLNADNPDIDIAGKWGDELRIPVHAFLFDARFFTQHGIRFDESLPTHEDFACWLRIFGMHPVVLYVDEKLAFYRWHNASMTHNSRGMMRGYLRALRVCRRDFRSSPEVRAALGTRIRTIRRYLRCSYLHWRVIYGVERRLTALGGRR